jgi:hypothetical protein
MPLAIDFMRQCVDEGIARGQLAADLNPDITAFTIVTLGIDATAQTLNNRLPISLSKAFSYDPCH